MLIALTMLISGINIMSIEANAEYGGNLTVTGGIAGIDYTYSSNKLVIYTGKPITISGRTETFV